MHVRMSSVSPDETKRTRCPPPPRRYGATSARAPLADYVARLREAGVSSFPGTSAEILDDRVRAALAPGRLSTAEWLAVVAAARDAGVSTSPTMMFGHVKTQSRPWRHDDDTHPMMFGHVETPRNVSNHHLVLLRDAQAAAVARESAARFTEVRGVRIRSRKRARWHAHTFGRAPWVLEKKRHGTHTPSAARRGFRSCVVSLCDAQPFLRS
jgi:2-iminoacetate synthase ThiH